ncbi:MAG: DUF1232 domain-containing protein [Xanthomonadaceae bacterium]|jgi:uncharacterized membrane protein YkvA (DUF1232 family)|nr:DUF1232 domain-containing protein [Xanthomonadaceae bacterium]
MSLTLTLTLTDRDLEHFARAIDSARAGIAGKPPAEVAQAAGALLARAKAAAVPDFVAERLGLLETLVAMIGDTAWSLPAADLERVVGALAYFSDPRDLVPDSVPVLGFLDDAIAIELAARELRHEIEAYDDFCEFRQREANRRGLDPAKLGPTDWLDARRSELHERMHQRRQRDPGVGYGASSGYGRRSYLANVWRPSTYLR